MTFLVIGLILFLGTHSLRLVAPGWREGVVARVGEGPFKGVVSIVSLVGLVLLIWGFGRASEEPAFIYDPPLWTRHVAEALMLPALVLFVAGNLPPGRIRRALRYPMLIGTLIWSIAHLFVNGEAATFVLFGAVFVWSLADILDQRNRPRVIAASAPIANDVIAIVIGVALYGLLVWRLHLWLFGVSPMA